MRILIDECIDERFRNSLTDHNCQTARYAGLAGLKNGDLLKAAELAKFDVFPTVDQAIEYQQNLTGRLAHPLAFGISNGAVLTLTRRPGGRAGRGRDARVPRRFRSIPE
jgi:hypothetical protein